MSVSNLSKSKVLAVNTGKIWYGWSINTCEFPQSHSLYASVVVKRVVSNSRPNIQYYKNKKCTAFDVKFHKFFGRYIPWTPILCHSWDPMSTHPTLKLNSLFASVVCTVHITIALGHLVQTVKQLPVTQTQSHSAMRLVRHADTCKYTSIPTLKHFLYIYYKHAWLISTFN